MQALRNPRATAFLGGVRRQPWRSSFEINLTCHQRLASVTLLALEGLCDHFRCSGCSVERRCFWAQGIRAPLYGGMAERAWAKGIEARVVGPEVHDRHGPAMCSRKELEALVRHGVMRLTLLGSLRISYRISVYKLNNIHIFNIYKYI